MFDKIIAALHALFHPDMTAAEIAEIMDMKAEKLHEGLEWRTSTIDLLKVLEMDSSIGARRHLALELGYTKAFEGTDADNKWLHDKVLAEVAKHGIKIP